MKSSKNISNRKYLPGYSVLIPYLFHTSSILSSILIPYFLPYLIHTSSILVPYLFHTYSVLIPYILSVISSLILKFPRFPCQNCVHVAPTAHYRSNLEAGESVGSGSFSNSGRRFWRCSNSFSESPKGTKVLFILELLNRLFIQVPEKGWLNIGFDPHVWWLEYQTND